jgi:hypothetical protein
MELRAWLDSFWDDALEAFRMEPKTSHKATKKNKQSGKVVEQAVPRRMTGGSQNRRQIG